MDAAYRARQRATQLWIENRITEAEYGDLLAGLSEGIVESPPAVARGAADSPFLSRWFLHRESSPDFRLAGVFLAVSVLFWTLVHFGIERLLEKPIKIFFLLGTKAPVLAVVVVDLVSLSSPIGWILPLGAIATAFFVAYCPEKNKRWVALLLFLLIFPVLWYTGLLAAYITAQAIPTRLGK